MRVIIAIALACTALTATAARAQDCALKKVAALDMSIADGIMRIPMAINGKTETMALQFGSAFSSVTEDTARELGLRFTSIPNMHMTDVVGLNVFYYGYSTQADLQLGSAPVPGFELLIDGPQSVAGRAGLAGGLGTSLLRVLDFDVDPAQGKFNIFTPDHCPGQVVYWTKSAVAEIPLEIDQDGYATFKAEMDGKPVQMKFGNQSESAMGSNAAYRVFGINKSDPGMIALPAPPAWLPPDTKVYSYKFKSLSVSGITIANPTVLIVDQPPVQIRCLPGGFCFDKWDVQLGTALWSKLHLYFSGKERVIYATPANAR